MTLDERLEAVAMNLELLSRELEDMKVVSRQDGENIRAGDAARRQDAENIHALTLIAQTTHDSIKSLERIALRHEERLDDLEQH